MIPYLNQPVHQSQAHSSLHYTVSSIADDFRNSKLESLSSLSLSHCAPLPSASSLSPDRHCYANDTQCLAHYN